jgi:hypothetical protein
MTICVNWMKAINFLVSSSIFRAEAKQAPTVWEYIRPFPSVSGQGINSTRPTVLS